jgi:two-component system phosphate regulon sensor histidine kinase PhoR
VDTLLNGALENPAVNRKFLENTYKNVERMVNLVSDLDEITKLESGEQPLYKENFIIQDLIKYVFETLSIKMVERNIKAGIKKGCEQPVAVFADKEKIGRVLTNLVENAVKYGSYGGNIVASVYNTDDRHVLIEISDDGIGISEEHLRVSSNVSIAQIQAAAAMLAVQGLDCLSANISLKHMDKPFMFAANRM